MIISYLNTNLWLQCQSSLGKKIDKRSYATKKLTVALDDPDGANQSFSFGRRAERVMRIASSVRMVVEP